MSKLEIGIAYRAVLMHQASDGLLYPQSNSEDKSPLYNEVPVFFISEL